MKIYYDARRVYVIYALHLYSETSEVIYYIIRDETLKNLCAITVQCVKQDCILKLCTRVVMPADLIKYLLLVYLV